MGIIEILGVILIVFAILYLAIMLIFAPLQIYEMKNELREIHDILEYWKRDRRIMRLNLMEKNENR